MTKSKIKFNLKSLKKNLRLKRLFQYYSEEIKMNTDNIEQYLRDQIDIDSLYEYDNKLIIDSGIKELLTKEGQKRFKIRVCEP